MKWNVFRRVQLCAALLLACVCGPLTRAATSGSAEWRTISILQTNRPTRVVTNVVEVRVPHNVFVDEYRTNWFVRKLTNVVDLAVTNWSHRTITNTVRVTAFQTNVVARYETNWITLIQTNQATLTLTNWETVVVTRTNWIRQPMTNVIDLNVPSSAAVVAKAEPVRVEAKPVFPLVDTKADVLIWDAVKTGQALGNAGMEVQFKARLQNDPEAALQVQWRVEREDGAILFSSQNQEFRRVLPTGRYQVVVKARRNADSRLLTLQSEVNVTRDTVARQ